MFESGAKADYVTAGSEFAYGLANGRADFDEGGSERLTSWQLTSWGINHFGQRNTPSSRVWPGNVHGRHSNRSLVETNPTRYLFVDAGDLHTCAITTEGELECWGDNSSGQTNVPMRLLVAQGDPSIPQPEYIKVSAGGEHTCVLTSPNPNPRSQAPIAGKVICWGANGYGQTNVPSTEGPFIDVTAGGQHTCAVRTDGSVICWGRNNHGQANEAMDVTIPVGRNYDARYRSKISAGLSHSCAINEQGGAFCWGSNLSGQEYPPAGEYSQITSGSWHACALWTEDDPPLRGRPPVLGHQGLPGLPGNVDCWGDNSAGKATPPEFVNFKQISAGGTFTCGITDPDNYIFCWGHGDAARMKPVYKTTPKLLNQTWDINRGRVEARTDRRGGMEVRFRVFVPGRNSDGSSNDILLSVFRRFVPSNGALTVGRWYYSDKLEFDELIAPPAGALETASVRVKCEVGRIGLRLLPSGHIELALMDKYGAVKMIPQNHNRIPNPVEPGKWWRTDLVRFD